MKTFCFLKDMVMKEKRQATVELKQRICYLNTKTISLSKETKKPIKK